MENQAGKGDEMLVCDRTWQLFEVLGETAALELLTDNR